MESLEDALKDIEVTKAKMILNEAKSGGFMDGDIPESPEDIVKEGRYFYEEAFKAHEKGMQHDTVLAILHIMDGEPGGGSDYDPGYASVEGMVPAEPAEDLRDKPVTNAVKVEGKEAPDERVSSSGNRGPVTPEGPHGDPVGATGAMGIAGWDNPDPVKQYNLPVPKDWEGDPEDFPRDISDLSDKNVRRLSGEYNAYLSRAKWLLAIALGNLQNGNHLRDHAYRVALKKTPKKDGEKAKLKEVLEAEVREDPGVAAYDDAINKFQTDIITLKALVDIYSGNVDRLSREWTMRQNEWEKSQ